MLVLSWAGHTIIKAFTLSHQGALQDDTALLVSLVLLCRKFVYPSQLGLTVFAGDIPHHVPSCQHDTVLNLTVLQVGYLVEQKGSASGTGETSGDQLCTISEGDITTGTGKQARTSQVFEEYSAHGGKYGPYDQYSEEYMYSDVLQVLKAFLVKRAGPEAHC